MVIIYYPEYSEKKNKEHKQTTIKLDIKQMISFTN